MVRIWIVRGTGYCPMRKSVKAIIVAGVVIVAAFVWAWPYIAMNFAGSAHYTEQDKREYEFYTPDLLKAMPRISPRYDFDFANITGPSSHVYAIRYYDADDSSKVDAYLETAGYKKQKECFIEATCWTGDDPQETVTVSMLESSKSILVSVVYNF